VTAAPATRRLPRRRNVIDRRNWKVPVVFGVVAVALLLVYTLLPRDGESRFNLSTQADLIQLPVLALPTALAGWISVVLLAAVALFTGWLVYGRMRVPLWLTAAGAVVAVIGFLAWAASGGTLQVPGLLSGALLLSVPIVYGALTGVIGERAGVVNIAIEAQLLFGAFTSAVVGSIAHNSYAGLIAAVLAGMLVGLVLALFAVKYFVEQVIVGVVVNVLVSGITGFLYLTWLSSDRAAFNSPPRFERIDIPLLSQIPVIGPTFFRQTIVVYALYVIVALVAYALYRTRWGLRLRSVGEHPKAADTVGIDVARTRFRNVVLSGGLAGAGGAFIVLGQAGIFDKDMTNGIGYIALAAVIFGRWDPIRATLAALLFGFASNLQNALSILGSPVPSQFMLMLPYVVTLLAVAGLVGRSRAPAADGQPYIK